MIVYRLSGLCPTLEADAGSQPAVSEVWGLGGSSRCACCVHEHASKALQQIVSHTAAHKNDDPNFDAEETATETPNN